MSHPLACPSGHALPRRSLSSWLPDQAQVKPTSQLSHSLRAYLSVSNQTNVMLKCSCLIVEIVLLYKIAFFIGISLDVKEKLIMKSEITWHSVEDH